MKKSEAKPAGNQVYRKLLLEKRKAVLSGMVGKFDTIARLGRVAEDDQAQLTHDEFVSVHLNSLDYAQLRLIEEALDRFRSGDFGVCQSCEQPIPEKRLRAVSWARYCVTCQELVGTESESGMAAAER